MLICVTFWQSAQNTVRSSAHSLFPLPLPHPPALMGCRRGYLFTTFADMTTEKHNTRQKVIMTV